MQIRPLFFMCFGRGELRCFLMLCKAYLDKIQTNNSLKNDKIQTKKSPIFDKIQTNNLLKCDKIQTYNMNLPHKQVFFVGRRLVKATFCV